MSYPEEPLIQPPAKCIYSIFIPGGENQGCEIGVRGVSGEILVVCVYVLYHIVLGSEKVWEPG